jgi:hypothetical protein
MAAPGEKKDAPLNVNISASSPYSQRLEKVAGSAGSPDRRANACRAETLISLFDIDIIWLKR